MSQLCMKCRHKEVERILKCQALGEFCIWIYIGKNYVPSLVIAFGWPVSPFYVTIKKINNAFFDPLMLWVKYAVVFFVRQL